MCDPLAPFSPLFIGETNVTNRPRMSMKQCTTFSPLFIGETNVTYAGIHGLLIVIFLSVPYSSGKQM